MADTFKNEAEFEAALVSRLEDFGWTGGVLHQPDEQDLLDNWAHILFKNNPGIDRLNGCPLTQGEMQQILEQIAALRTPMRLNGFINGRTVSIKRDNPDDAAHFGKEVSLYIYDRLDIAAGRSVYQIAEQPRFKAASARLNDRRGDVMLLINGMPLIHIELKRSGVPVSQACNQIQKYAHEGVFSGLFSLVQIFVAMEPAETVYFANPGATGDFSLFRFHWADFNNEPINDWNDVVRYLLSIPMAHQLIGFYSVADDKDATLKVMRSYQYYAASAISDRVRKSRWDKESARGGYVWHTTGSGKTMTSFKSAQLIYIQLKAPAGEFFSDCVWLITQQIGIEHAYPVLIELNGRCGHSLRPQGYSNNITATITLTVAFYGAILILFSQPGELFANLAFKAPVCREIIACLCYFRREVNLTGSISVCFIMSVTIFLPVAHFLH